MLISTLVMSIGVVALATLFPISVLRSIQASQLTNAANLRYNAEALIRTVPAMVSIGEEWQPVTQYAQYDAVVPPPEFKQSTVHYNFAGTNTSLGTPPDFWPATWDGDAPRAQLQPPDGSLDWRGILLGNYVIDPLGYVLVDSADADARPRRFGAGPPLTGAQQHFGNVAGNSFYDRVNRFPAFGLFRQGDPAALNEVRAAAVSVLPDSWALQAESLEVAYTAGATDIILGGVDAQVLSSSVSVPAAGTADLVPDRLVILDESGRRSHVRYIAPPSSASITAVGNATQIAWTGPALPTNFTPVKARVESLERRYSYLLSVRRGPSGASYTDVVVFFRRSFSETDEQVYSCVFRKKDRGTIAGPTDDKPRNFVIVQYSSAGEKPFFKKGGYICDAQNLHWYRIIDVYEPILPGIAAATPTGSEVDPPATTDLANPPNPIDRFVRLTLHKEIEEDSLPNNLASMTPMEFQNGRPVAPGTGGVVGGAILMRGVVDVFPLRPLTQ